MKTFSVFNLKNTSPWNFIGNVKCWNIFGNFSFLWWNVRSFFLYWILRVDGNFKLYNGATRRRRKLVFGFLYASVPYMFSNQITLPKLSFEKGLKIFKWPTTMLFYSRLKVLYILRHMNNLVTSEPHGMFLSVSSTEQLFKKFACFQYLWMLNWFHSLLNLHDVIMIQKVIKDGE